MSTFLKSRKFWLLVFGIIQTIVLHYMDIPEEIWQAIDALVMALIGAIALEDAGQKSGGNA